jgi:hypothetical protein
MRLDRILARALVLVLFFGGISVASAKSTGTSASAKPGVSSRSPVEKTDDSDLSGAPPSPRPFAPGPELRPDRTETQAAPQQLIVQVVREVRGEFQPVAGLSLVASGSRFGKMPATTDSSGMARWASQCSESPRVPIRAELRDSHFLIQAPGARARPYAFVAEVACEGWTRLIVTSDSDAGQALGIWQVATRAKARLQQAIGLRFWSRPITFNWPGDGDYYLNTVVTLTRGDHWDVVGHELGHAIYDLGRIGRKQGGQHRIDECYSETLALSEGWASYFSAFVSVAWDDPDAKFEFMVPRRAPLRFESIPADVCAGQTNEWRVTGFFWDLLDLHDDGEQVEQSFAALWSALEGSMVRSSSEAAARFERAGVVPRATLQQVWRQNFLR